MEKELWQPLSSLALKSVNLAGLTGHGASLVRASASGESRGGVEGGGSVSPGAGKAGFGEWLVKGNPFGEKVQAGPGVSKVADGGAVKVNGVDNVGVVANGGPKVEDEEDDENEDLLADFIDEDSQLPGRLYHNFGKRSSAMEAKSSQVSSEDKSVVLTNSSVNILR